MDDPKLNNQPKSKKLKKTNLLAILILVAVLLGAIIIAGYYYFIPEDRANKNDNINNSISVNTNTNTAANTTAGWKNYSNKHGFILKYPSDWQITDKSTANMLLLNISPLAANNVNRETASPILAITDFIAEHDFLTLENQTEITINNIKATQGIQKGPNIFATYLTRTVGDYFKISWPLANEYTEIMNQIIATFQFAEVD